MILSNQNSLSLNQAITGASVASDYIIDLGDRHDGAFDFAWNKIPFISQVTADIPGATALSVTLQCSDTVTGGALVSPAQIGTYSFDGVTAGSRARIHSLPYGALKRYLACSYTANGTVTAGGTVTTGFTTGNEENP